MFFIRRLSEFKNVWSVSDRCPNGHLDFLGHDL